MRQRNDDHKFPCKFAGRTEEEGGGDHRRGERAREIRDAALCLSVATTRGHGYEIRGANVMEDNGKSHKNHAL